MLDGAVVPPSLGARLPLLENKLDRLGRLVETLSIVEGGGLPSEGRSNLPELPFGDPLSEVSVGDVGTVAVELDEADLGAASGPEASLRRNSIHSVEKV